MVMAAQVQVPAWADMVKLSTGSELAPYDADWFYIRTGPSPCSAFYPSTANMPAACSHYWRSLCAAAAVARRIYIRGALGTKTLQKIFGSTKRNGVGTSFSHATHVSLLRIFITTGDCHIGMANAPAAPPHFVKAAGSPCRAVLKALDALKVVEKSTEG